MFFYPITCNFVVGLFLLSVVLALKWPRFLLLSGFWIKLSWFYCVFLEYPQSIDNYSYHQTFTDCLSDKYIHFHMLICQISMQVMMVLWFNYVSGNFHTCMFEMLHLHQTFTIMPQFWIDLAKDKSFFIYLSIFSLLWSILALIFTL